MYTHIDMFKYFSLIYVILSRCELNFEHNSIRLRGYMMHSFKMKRFIHKNTQVYILNKISNKLTYKDFS